MDIKDLWDRQAQQQRLFYNLDSLNSDRQAAIVKELLLLLYEESGELARKADLAKFHLLNQPELVVSNILEEGVDVFKTVLSILQLFGIQPGEFVEGFFRKTAVVDEKWRAEQTKLENDTLIFGTDLDGCVVDMAEFDAYLSGVRGGDSGEVVAALEAIKERFYKGGGFMALPPIEGAVEALNEIRDMGYTIIAITARPQWQYARLRADTMAWLNNTGVPYDHLFFNKDKAEAIWDNLHPARPALFVEDRLKHVHELSDIEIPVLLFDPKDKHGGESLPPKTTKITSWAEAVTAAREVKNGR